VTYPENIERKIEFDKIRLMLADLCISPMGREFVEKMRFGNRFDVVEKLLKQTDEFRRIILFGKPFPAQDYFDLIPELKRIALPGTYILQENLFNMRASLTAIHDVLDYLHSLDKEEFPALNALTGQTQLDPGLLTELDRIIDDRGAIRDSASEKLMQVRRSLIRLSGQIEKTIRHVLKNAVAGGWVAPNEELTIRNGRLVIPVPAAHKRRIRGFIHDESSSGQTVFIEPAEV